MYKFTRCGRLLDLYGECLEEVPVYIACKFRNDETHVTHKKNETFLEKINFKIKRK